MRLVLFVICAASANAFYVGKEFDGHKKDRIVGGEKTRIESFPYQAQILSNGDQICGASIISDQWILTAAHCIVSSSPKWTVMTGSSKLGVGGSHHEIQYIIVHAEYNKESVDNDIAMLKLTKPIAFNERQRPIAVSSELPKAGEKMTVSGFGKRGEYLPRSQDLEVATVQIMDHRECQSRYKEDPITSNMLCAGNGATDACQGDSGGPAVVDGRLVGVISAGMECASKVYPGVYTKLYNYRSWMAGIVRDQRSSFGCGKVIENKKKSFFQANVVEPSKVAIEAVKSFIGRATNQVTTWARGISETLTNFFHSVF